MKKTLSSFIDPAIGRKILLCVKLTTLIILAALVHVTAAVRSQDKLNLNVKGVKFEKFFELIEKQSNYTFLYNNGTIPRGEVNIDVNNVTVPQILDNALKNTGLAYRILPNNLVVITKASAPQVADITIKGKVVDSKGEPLPGATIAIKNGNSIGSTDVNGNFNITVPDNTILVVSYVGYKPQEVETSGRSEITVTLLEDAGNLNEVIVTGYGTQRKKDLTGAVSVINTKDINGIPVGGIDQIMQGKASGVSVTQNTGAPGSGIDVHIRGLGTINGVNPLYIIDGTPTTDGINQIAPDDVESINILKDASSAAIYGARAAGGVVIITTKHGNNGKQKLSVNAYTGVQSATHLIKMADNAQYVKAYNMAAVNDGRPIISDSLASTLSDVNWLKAVLKPAPVTNINLSVSGGTETSNYIVSGNVFSQGGLIENSSFNRYNLRTAVNSSPTKYLKFGTNVNLSYSKTRSVGSSGDGYSGAAASVVRYALFRTPGTPVYGPNGQFVDLPKQVAPLGNFLGDGVNPVQEAASTNDNNYNYSVLGDVFAELTPIKNLRIKSDLGLNLIQTDYKQFFESYGADRNFNTPNSLAQSHNQNLEYNWTNTATYDLKLDKHAFTFLAGTEIIKQDQQGLSASRTTFVNQTPNFQYLDNGTLTTALNGGSEYPVAYSSFFSRINYQYNNKYLASFNYRWDASSELDPDAQSHSFYSGSLGWRIDQEDFMKDIKPISALKLRVDVGQVGNSQNLPQYEYLSTFIGGSYYPFNGVTNQGYTINKIGNPNIRWEVNTQEDVGLDLGLFNNALQVTADYYIKNTNNVLLPLQLPSSAGGAAAPVINAGRVRDQGFELDVNYSHKFTNDWNFSLNGNFATLKNTVVSLDGAPSITGGRIDNNIFATRTDVGHPVGSFYLLQQEGIFQNTQQVFTHAYQGPGIRPGDVMYKDVNGDGVIDQNDRVFAGSPIPKFTYGLTATVGYQNFDLSVFFQGVYGNKIYDQVMTESEGFYRPFNVTEATATQSWTGPGTSNTNPLLSWTDGTNNKQASTRFLESGSYMKVKNVQLGYKLGKNALKTLGLSSVRIYVSGQNLLTFTKYKGLDPEQYQNDNNAGDGVRAVGIDWGTYPSALILTAGINANF
ncbi:SusC/RagA family TonB-linked outer membrane protein [Mucilaginibacter sp. dw_454]|uniref:SusC/RagA family TonB-linked outer membrane protein n=1 Tax=Mucilaginibacter sp. dw_454 TaxID=2720079 RepID=UPI001BD4A77C|nr:SusC/RagA family TonB-linked outer membrane protein [Mucilaginibacter sp. dw_454]